MKQPTKEAERLRLQAEIFQAERLRLQARPRLGNAGSTLILEMADIIVISWAARCPCGKCKECKVSGIRRILVLRKVARWYCEPAAQLNKGGVVV